MLDTCESRTLTSDRKEHTKTHRGDWKDRLGDVNTHTFTVHT